MQAYLMSG